MRLLIVEDDTDLATRLQGVLRQHGFAVDVCHNGVDGEFQGREFPYDAIVLDLGLPDRPGLEVLGHWRAGGLRTPILILTARDTWQQKVEGLQRGADDYLTKPFHEAELVARLQALIRRSSDRADPVLRVHGLELDEETQSVRRGDRRWDLTATEFRLLRYFMRHPGRILSKSRLTDHVYEMDADKDSNVIEVYVNRLRRKLGSDIITTRRGQGYVFGDPGCD